LEYTIDLTEEGIARQKSKHQDFSGTGQQNNRTNPTPVKKKEQSFPEELLFLTIIALFLTIIGSFVVLLGTCLLQIIQDMWPKR
jgi:hypothetical protein